MFDAHCHLDSSRFDADRGTLLERARSLGVRGFIVAGVGPSDWGKQRSVCEIHSELHACYGIHPHVAARLPDGGLSEAMEQLAGFRGVGIGETGLDSSKYVPRGSLLRQLEAYRAQLAFARERESPVVLHVLGRHAMALDTLTRDGAPACGGLVHSYSGSAELVPRYEALGMYISFSGAITRPTARRWVAAARAVSPDRLLVETDCPDQRPSTREGSRNLPEWLPVVLERLAEGLGEAPEVLAERTSANARRLFGLEENG